MMSGAGLSRMREAAALMSNATPGRPCFRASSGPDLRKQFVRFAIRVPALLMNF